MEKGREGVSIGVRVVAQGQSIAHHSRPATRRRRPCKWPRHTYGVKIAVQFGSTYRSPVGPIIHHLTISFEHPRISAEEDAPSVPVPNPKEPKEVVFEALKEAITALRDPYIHKNGYGDFDAYSPVFHFTKDLSLCKPLFFNAQTPHKNDPIDTRAHSFQQDIIDQLRFIPNYEKFLNMELEEPAPPQPAGFTLNFTNMNI